MTSQYHETAIEELKQLYTLRNEAQIIPFLEDTPLLYGFLHEVYPTLQQYFSNETYILEFMAIPDEAKVEKLFIYIETRQSVDFAMDVLDQLTKEYWLDLDFSIRQAVVVDVECL
jgi:hypothetical protein